MQLLIAVAIVVLLFVIKVLKTYNDPVWKNIPGPSYKLPFFGLAFELVNYGGVSTYQTKWSKQYGPVCRYYIWGFTTVLVTDPALVKHVLLNNRLFDKDILDYHFLSDIIGKGLITEWDESKHKYHRSIVGPAFSHHHVRGLAPIFQNKAAILVEDWLKQADTGVPVSIKEGIAKASSDAIGEAAFGYKLNSQRTDSPNSIYHIFAAILGHSYSNVLQVLPVVKNLIPSYHRKMATINLLDQQVNKMVNEKIEKRNNKVGEGENEQRDLLDIMMDCKNDDGAMLTKAELSDETKTVLLAGYETTSTCVMWTCFLLAKYPEIQQRVADEVLSVIGRDKIPTAEDIDEMPYLYKVLRESLRYYPPVPLFVRRATQDTELGGYKITKGTRIHINIHHQHHNSPIWDKPEVFNPDRWGNDESEGNLLGSYMPFIMGARNCVGSKFAQLEVRVIVAMIIQKLKLEKVPGRADPEPLARISTFPSTPILVHFSRRI